MWAMRAECDFASHPIAMGALQQRHADGVAHNPLFFLLADAKAHIIPAGADGFTKKSTGAIVCHSCGGNCAMTLCKSGGQEVALDGIGGPHPSDCSVS